MVEKELQPPKFNKQKMMRLLKQDRFLRFAWENSPNQTDDYLEAFFNSYILDSDSFSWQAYDAA